MNPIALTEVFPLSHFFGALPDYPASVFRISTANSFGLISSIFVSTTTPARLSGAIRKSVLVPCCPPLWPTTFSPSSSPTPQPRPYVSFEPSECFQRRPHQIAGRALHQLAVQHGNFEWAMSSAEDSHPPPGIL